MASHRSARESCGIHQLSALLDRAADIGVADPNNLPGPDRRTPPPECSARRAAKASAGAAAAKWQERRQAPQACSGTSASTRGPALRCKTSGVRSQRCNRHQDSVGRLTARARREAKTRPVPISLRGEHGVLVVAEVGRQRFIPVGAGNTARRRRPGRTSAVHPRGRGEHVSTRPGLYAGSSPRARGTHFLYSPDSNAKIRSTKSHRENRPHRGPLIRIVKDRFPDHPAV